MEGNIVNYITQIRGVSYKPSDLHDSLNENSIILLRANNIDEGKINFEDVVYVDKSKVSETQILRENDILICASSGSKNLVGKAASFNGNIECTFGAFCKVIRPRNILGSYLSAFFQSKYYRFHISQFANGANINNIKNEHINSFSIPERTLEEQKEISYKVFSLNRVIEKYNRELELLDELVKARFVEMFGGINDSVVYPYKKLNEITIIISGGTPKRDKPEYWEDGIIPWVKTTELKNNKITYVEEHITQKGLSESSAKLVPQGTVLIAMYGQGKTRGMTAYLNVEASTNQACACILPSEKINSVFLWKYLEFSYVKLRSLAKGAGQPNLNVNMIKEFSVLVPPLNLQEEYASFVEEVDKSRLLSNHSLLLLKSIIF